MKKRLRKKLRRGEFQEFGFSLAWQFSPQRDAPGRDLFLDALLERITALGLTFGGGGGMAQGGGFVCKAERGSPSEANRLEVAAWFPEQGADVAGSVGPLVDAWHPATVQVKCIREWIESRAEIIILPPVQK